MSIALYEIHHAEVELRNCSDSRPVIVIREPQEDPGNPGSHVVDVAPISSQFDLINSGFDFVIDDKDPSFERTGLPRRSYIIVNKPMRIGVECLKKKYGDLAGSLRGAFAFYLPPG